MNVFEFAKKMEKDGEAYYTGLAAGTPVRGLKKILEMLADSERTHFSVLSDMEKGLPGALPDAAILDKARNVFEGMDKSQFKSTTPFPHIDLYDKALDIERTSREFYERKAEEAGEGPVRETLLKIAEEERQHHILMQETIEFLQRPYRWLENAEWSR